jgi:hypothetical protein
VTQGDLAQRTLYIKAPRLPDEKRREKAEFWEAFTRDHPYILGALLDAMVHGLRELPNTNLVLPRMADFARWSVACEGAYAKSGSFLARYVAAAGRTRWY